MPSELVRLVGYLDAVAGNLVLDLVTVTAYDINGSRVMVPQRVDPERQASEVAPNIRGPKGTTGYATRGASVFVEAIDTSPEEYRDDLRRLSDGAIALEQQGIARLSTYHGKAMINLLPYLVDENVGLVTIYNNRSLSVWRTVFERRAPKSITRVEAAIGARIGSGNPADAPVGVMARCVGAHLDRRV